MAGSCPRIALLSQSSVIVVRCVSRKKPDAPLVSGASIAADENVSEPSYQYTVAYGMRARQGLEARDDRAARWPRRAEEDVPEDLTRLEARATRGADQEQALVRAVAHEQHPTATELGHERARLDRELGHAAAARAVGDEQLLVAQRRAADVDVLASARHATGAGDLAAAGKRDARARPGNGHGVLGSGR